MDNDQRRGPDESRSRAQEAFERALDDLFGPPELSSQTTARPVPERRTEPGSPAGQRVEPPPRSRPVEAAAPSPEPGPTRTAPEWPGPHTSEPSERSRTAGLRRLVMLGCLAVMLLFFICVFGPLFFTLITGSESSSRPDPAQEVVEVGTAETGSVQPVAFGEAAEIGDDWILRIDDVTHDATRLVLDENSFNEPPQEGWQYLIADVTVWNVDDEPRAFDATFRLRLRGLETGRHYLTFDDGTYCGVVPDRFPDDPIPSGEELSGNICWGVEVRDINSLILYSESYNNQEREVEFEVPAELQVRWRASRARRLIGSSTSASEPAGFGPLLARCEETNERARPCASSRTGQGANGRATGDPRPPSRIAS